MSQYREYGPPNPILTFVDAGVLIEHRSIVAFQETLQNRLLSQPGHRIAQFLSPGFDVCLHEILSALCHGATLVLRTDDNDPFSHLKSVDTAVFTPSVAASMDPASYPEIKTVSVHLIFGANVSLPLQRV